METVEIIIAIMTITIASTALYSSIKSSKAQQAHNKLSVKPLLVFSPHPYSKKWEIYIKNVGLGPAIIKDKTLFHKNRPIHFDTWDTFQKNVVDELIDDGGFYGYCDPIIEGTVIEPGDTHLFFEITWHDGISGQELSDKLSNFLGDTTLNINYTSLNNEPFSKCLKSLITSETRTLY